jgi:hypothetical protein
VQCVCYFINRIPKLITDSILLQFINMYIKNHRVTVMIEYDVYMTVLQRVGWALPRPFLYIHLFFKIKNPFITATTTTAIYYNF